MKKTILIIFILFPTFLFAGGKKDTVYEYLTGIEGMSVEIVDSVPLRYSNKFHFGYYKEYGAEQYGKQFNSYYKSFLQDKRVQKLIDLLDGYVSGRQFIVLNDLFYIAFNEELMCYSLDTMKLIKSIKIENSDPSNTYLSIKSRKFYYLSESDCLVIINLDSFNEEKRIPVSHSFEMNDTQFWDDFGNNILIGMKFERIDRSIYLFNGNTQQEYLLLDMKPVKIQTKTGYWGSVYDIRVVNETTICFYADTETKHLFCEYTIPEEYLTSSSD